MNELQPTADHTVIHYRCQMTCTKKLYDEATDSFTIVIEGADDSDTQIVLNLVPPGEAAEFEEGKTFLLDAGLEAI